jgi:hypothetical protein
MIIPTNYILELDSDDYKEFMNNVLAWLPFKVDESVNQRAKKWESFEGGIYHYNEDGRLFDVLPFIPKTSKNEQYLREFSKVESLDNLERWFIQRMGSGNRNNQLIKYAFALVDSGLTLSDVQSKVKSLNSKLTNPLSEKELEATIFVSVANKYLKK